MANAASRTVTAVLTTVSTAADTITSTFEALGTGSSMLNRFATEAAKDQADKAKTHRKDYRSNLVTQSALEQAKLKLEVNTYLAANPSIDADFQTIHAEYAALFAD